MLFYVDEIIKGQTLITINQDKKVDEALALMIEYDFSFLPVVNDNNFLTGIISEQSLIRKYYHLGGEIPLFPLYVKDCQMEAATLPRSANMFEALVPLEKNSAVIIVDTQNNEKEPVGIITDFDATRFFLDYSRGLMVCENIETLLRRHIEDVFPIGSIEMNDALIAAFNADQNPLNAGQPRRKYEELDLGKHVQLVVTDANWSKFNGVFEPKNLFIKLLGKVGNARNQKVHFRGEMNRVQLDALNHARSWLETRSLASSKNNNQPQPVELTATGTITVTGTVIPGLTDTSTQVQPPDNQPVSPVDEPENPDNDNPVDTLPADSGQYSADTQPDNSGPISEEKTENKYDRLGNWLVKNGRNKTEVWTFFKVIEEVLGEQLPPSAYEHQSWWANDSKSHRQSIAWLNAGWRVVNVDMVEGRVTFARAAGAISRNFLSDIRERFKALRPEFPQARKDNSQFFITFESGYQGFTYIWGSGMAYGYGPFRVELYINTGQKEKNAEAFEILAKQQVRIEQLTGFPLIKSDTKNSDGSGGLMLELKKGHLSGHPEELQELKQIAVDTMNKFVDIIQPVLKELTQA